MKLITQSARTIANVKEYSHFVKNMKTETNKHSTKPLKTCMNSQTIECNKINNKCTPVYFYLTRSWAAAAGRVFGVWVVVVRVRACAVLFPSVFGPPLFAMGDAAT